MFSQTKQEKHCDALHSQSLIVTEALFLGLRLYVLVRARSSISGAARASCTRGAPGASLLLNRTLPQWTKDLISLPVLWRGGRSNRNLEDGGLVPDTCLHITRVPLVGCLESMAQAT